VKRVPSEKVFQREGKETLGKIMTEGEEGEELDLQIQILGSWGKNSRLKTKGFWDTQKRGGSGCDRNTSDSDMETRIKTAAGETF